MVIFPRLKGEIYRKSVLKTDKGYFAQEVRFKWKSKINMYSNFACRSVVSCPGISTILLMLSIGCTDWKFFPFNSLYYHLCWHNDKYVEDFLSSIQMGYLDPVSSLLFIQVKKFSVILSIESPTLA